MIPIVLLALGLGFVAGAIAGVFYAADYFLEGACRPEPELRKALEHARRDAAEAHAFLALEQCHRNSLEHRLADATEKNERLLDETRQLAVAYAALARTMDEQTRPVLPGLRAVRQ